MQLKAKMSRRRHRTHRSRYFDLQVHFRTNAQGKARFGARTEAELEEVLDAPFALTTFQRMYLDIAPDYRPHDDHDHLYNQCLLLRLVSTITVYRLARAIEAIVQRHSINRQREWLDTEDFEGGFGIISLRSARCHKA